MISNQVLQNTIDGLKNITKLDFAISDVEGKTLVSTFQELEISKAELLSFAQSQADSQIIRAYQFFKVYDDLQLEYILIVKGGDEESLLPGKMAAFQLQSLLTAYKERFDNVSVEICDYRNPDSDEDAAGPYIGHFVN